MPPLPKKPSSRQRRNRAVAPRTLNPDARRDGPLPPLYVYDRARDWDVRTKRWWRSVWVSPMTRHYVDVDREGLGSLAILKDMFFKDPETAMAAEIRLQEARFGLSPLDRRRLEWEIERPDVARKRDVRPAARAARSDPRLFLLDGGKE